MSTVTASRHGALEAVGRPFRQLLVNTLVTGVTSTFLWFALTFWVYLETRSVVATGVIGGAFSISSAVLGPFFGTFVDRHRKHTAMVLTTAVSLACFAVATAVFVAVDSDDLLRPRSPWFWVLVGLDAARLGRRPDARHRAVDVRHAARARGPARPGQRHGRHGHRRLVRHHVGVQRPRHRRGSGMGWAYYGVARADGRRARPPAHDRDRRAGARSRPPTARRRRRGVDVRGALDGHPRRARPEDADPARRVQQPARRRVHGADGRLRPRRSCRSRRGACCGAFISLAFIAGGLVVARRGLGPNPLRVVLVGNLVNWAVCSVFALRSSIVLLDDRHGRVARRSSRSSRRPSRRCCSASIPFERQGRVFGFAQLVENAASPLTAFLMAPLAEAVFMPLMTDGRGADWIGELVRHRPRPRASR